MRISRLRADMRNVKNYGMHWSQWSETAKAQMLGEKHELFDPTRFKPKWEHNISHDFTFFACSTTLKEQILEAVVNCQKFKKFCNLFRARRNSAARANWKSLRFWSLWFFKIKFHHLCDFRNTIQVVNAFKRKEPLDPLDNIDTLPSSFRLSFFL